MKPLTTDAIADIETCTCEIVHTELLIQLTPQLLTEKQFDKLTLFFKAIADTTRLKILNALLTSEDSNTELCVCDLAELLSLTVSAISHQLRVLKQAELVRFEKRGKVVFYHVSDNHVRTMLENAIEHVNE